MYPTTKLEKQKYASGFEFIVGCDEVGKGSLAGPVVAASVVLPQYLSRGIWRGIKDSKQLTPEARINFARLIKAHALGWSIAQIEPKKIDAINIHQATLSAMRLSVEKLVRQLSLVAENTTILVDGTFKIPGVAFLQQPVVGGDAKILSVAAASIIAKVYRDELMIKLHRKYPNYEFGKHKGYGTKIHLEAIREFGLSPIHRVSFCGNIV